MDPDAIIELLPDEGTSAPASLYLAFEIYLVSLLITLPRMYAFLTYSQLLTSNAAPRMARQAIILVLAAATSPMNLQYAKEIPTELPLFALLFFKEFVIGFLMGYAVAWLFWCVQAAGGLIDNQRGAAIAASIDPLQGHESTPIGNVLSQAFMTYFLASGGFLILLMIIMQSYLALPVNVFIPAPPEELPRMALEIIDLGMEAMFVLAGPVLVAMFLAELALALVSRFAPQVQVFILAMPIKSGIAIIILIFYIQTFMVYAMGQESLLDGYMLLLYEMLNDGPPLPGGE
ncbi:MAG: type III secretion system export apparatus subunit SctT [Pseudomonadota bacterium]